MMIAIVFLYMIAKSTLQYECHFLNILRDTSANKMRRCRMCSIIGQLCVRIVAIGMAVCNSTFFSQGQPLVIMITRCK